MRKSWLKTPPSEPSSRVAPAPAALVAVDARRRAARRNGSATPYTGVPRLRVAVEAEVDEGVEEHPHLTARVRLLEGFVSRTEMSDCAQFALQWLGEVLGVAQSICLIHPGAEAALFVIGSYGLRGSGV